MLALSELYRPHYCAQIPASSERSSSSLCPSRAQRTEPLSFPTGGRARRPYIYIRLTTRSETTARPRVYSERLVQIRASARRVDCPYTYARRTLGYEETPMAMMRCGNGESSTPGYF